MCGEQFCYVWYVLVFIIDWVREREGKGRGKCCRIQLTKYRDEIGRCGGLFEF